MPCHTRRARTHAEREVMTRRLYSLAIACQRHTSYDYRGPEGQYALQPRYRFEAHPAADTQCTCTRPRAADMQCMRSTPPQWVRSAVVKGCAQCAVNGRLGMQETCNVVAMAETTSEDVEIIGETIVAEPDVEITGESSTVLGSSLFEGKR